MELYGVLPRQFLRRLVRIYYPKIEITGREHLPATGAVLFVANHPNSIIDPVLVGIAADRRIHFLAKAPLFDVPVFGTLLHALGMLPIYRAVDDPSRMKGNVDSLSAAAACLARGEAVGIFPEGKSHDLAAVEQVKNGAARIAIQAAQMGGAPLCVAAIGINYERKERFRSAVWLHIDKPIDMPRGGEITEANERSYIRSVTEAIAASLKRAAIHLNEPAWEPFLDSLEILRPATPATEGEPRSGTSPLLQRKRLANAMNHFLASDRPRAEATAKAIDHLQKKLQSAGLTLRSMCLRLAAPALVWRWLWRSMLLVVSLVPALAGAIFHLPPLLLTLAIASRLKYPGKSTIAPAKFGVGVPLYLGWYVISWFLLSRSFGPGIATLAIMVAPYLGMLALGTVANAASFARTLGSEFRLFARPRLLRSLRKEFREVQDLLEDMSREYATIHPL